MIVGVVGAVVACLAYGTSSVLQAYGARRSAARARTLPRARQLTAAGAPTLASTVAAGLTGWFILGTALDVIGFVGGAAAARLIPLFLSQTILSANLIVTAVLGTAVLGSRMHRRDWLAVAMVILGLAILAVTAAGGQGSVAAGPGMHLAVPLAAGVVLVLGQVLVRRLGSGGAATAGLMAGLLFGVLAIAVRVVEGLAPLHWAVLLADPAAWAVIVAGVGGFYLHTVALQMGSVNGATAALVVGETVVPGIVGVALLGDTARPGLGWFAATGFVLAVAAAIAVAAFGSETSPAPRPGRTPRPPGHRPGPP